MERLFQTSNQLLAQVQTDFQRYIYQQINWKNRLIGLIGARGIGKTTLVLQHIKANLNPQKSLYVTTEDFYFAQHRLTDLAETFVKAGGEYLVIDEIHKYPDWSRELKLIYDYHPNLKVVFTGSSVLDIKKGSADLSRRAIVYSMQGLSFREYLHLFHKIEIPVYSLDDVLNQRVVMPANFILCRLSQNWILPLFARDEFRHSIATSHWPNPGNRYPQLCRYERVYRPKTQTTAVYHRPKRAL
jgi:predicted AAA+ superfamily ATPase